MSTRTLAVVSAGLSNPSSTRLLADRLTAATVEALRARGVAAAVEVVGAAVVVVDVTLSMTFPNSEVVDVVDVLDVDVDVDVDVVDVDVVDVLEVGAVVDVVVVLVDVAVSECP